MSQIEKRANVIFIGQSPRLDTQSDTQSDMLLRSPRYPSVTHPWRVHILAPYSTYEKITKHTIKFRKNLLIFAGGPPSYKPINP